MKKEYWIILIVYIGMQFSSFIGIPLLTILGEILGKNPESWAVASVSYWLLFSFTITTIIILFILQKEMKQDRLERNSLPFGISLLWAIIGIFLALISQTIAANIENLLGIEPGSENTKEIMEIINLFPFVIIVSSILGPVLEEIVFRKILFGSLYKRFNFFLSGLISSVIFALAHMEPEHVLLYSAMGFTFAFLYVKTKRIWVPIFAHVSMNTFVVLIQSIFKEDIEKMMRDAEKIQGFISLFM
ncbi:CPBP family intramembrane glutamic endopeptidase [Bacillus sp. CGMCC 1.16607]|uniref:CPBP family intramembrane glutamic endopeptidase n=1 Tax=Bacillus sp. CGMCC 1.16607 TaxID=3351842 RepID=UPI0036285EC6